MCKKVLVLGLAVSLFSLSGCMQTQPEVAQKSKQEVKQTLSVPEGYVLRTINKPYGMQKLSFVVPKTWDTDEVLSKDPKVELIVGVLDKNQFDGDYESHFRSGDMVYGVQIAQDSNLKMFNLGFRDVYPVMSEEKIPHAKYTITKKTFNNMGAKQYKYTVVGDRGMVTQVYLSPQVIFNQDTGLLEEKNPSEMQTVINSLTFE